MLQAIIPSYILFLLLSKKGSMVFSPEYQAIIERTPHIQYRTSWIVKGCLIVLVGTFLFAFVGAFLGIRRREGRSPASGCDLAARPTLEPDGLRSCGRLLIAFPARSCGWGVSPSVR